MGRAPAPASLQQPGAGGGVHRAVDASATAQLGVRGGHDGLDVLTGDVTPHHRDLHARMLPGSSFLRSLVAYAELPSGPLERRGCSRGSYSPG